jgi:hypothetical protein
MANNIVLWYNYAIKAVELSTGDRKITLAVIKQQMGSKTMYGLTAQKVLNLLALLVQKYKYSRRRRCAAAHLATPPLLLK